MIYQVVVVAAGRGARMGAAQNKVLLPIRGIPVICRTLRVFDNDPDCAQIVLVAKPSEQDTFRSVLAKENLATPLAFADGGKERQDSVYNGLLAISGREADPIVLIHDGARPFLKKEQIAAVTSAADEMGAAILAVPVKDTIKEISEGEVKQTLKRESLWAVQTPQAFRLSLILEAHRQGVEKRDTVTDDASLVEQCGLSVRVVRGSYENIKLTTPEDMIFAEKLLEEEEKKQ